MFQWGQTNAQMSKMKTNVSTRRKLTSPGIKQLSSQFQELAKDTDPQTSLTHPTLGAENINTILGPDAPLQQTVEQITPPAQVDTPKIVQANQSNSTKLLLSSLGVSTKPDIPQIDSPRGGPGKNPDQEYQTSKTGGKRNREHEINQTCQNR